MNTVETLRRLPLHDATISELTFAPENELIKLSVTIWDEKQEGYRILLLVFSGAGNFSSDDNNFLSLDEIFSVEIQELAPQNFSIEFCILTGFSKPSARIKFDFDNVEISW